VSYRDIAPSGLRVLGSAVENRVEPFVQFGADPLIGLPTDTRNLRIARRAEVCAFKGQNDLAYTVTRSGIVTPHGKVAGDQAVALSPSGILAYVIDPGGSRPPVEYSFNGVARPIPAHRLGTSQGIHDVDDEGHVTWGDDRLVPSTFGPLSLIKWTTDGAWTWGTTPWGCGVWNAVTQRAYIAVLDSEMRWTMRGAVVGGQLILARSLPADEIPEARFLPYDPALVWQDEPPCPVPTFAPAEHDVVVRAFGGPGYDGRHIFPAVPGRRRALVFLDTRESAAVRLERARLAAELDADLGLYTDHPTFDLEAIEQVFGLCRDHHVPVTVVPIQQMYPWRDAPKLIGEMRHWSTQGAKIRTSMRALRARYPERRIGAAVAYYRQIDAVDPHPVYNWPLRSVLDLQEEAWAIVRRHRLSDVLPFVWSRAAGQDGIVSRPELRQSFDRLSAAANAGPVAQPLPPTPPADNNPDTDIPEVPVVSPSSLLAADEVMRRGDERRSPDGRYRLFFQLDGNVVEYGPGLDDEIEPLWDSATVGDAADRLVMQADGNVVLYDRNGAPLWDTGTAGHPGAVLRVVSGRGVEIVAPDGELLWAGPVITDEALDDVFTPPVVVPPQPRPTPRPSLGSGGLIAWFIGLFTRREKEQAPLPNPEIPPAPEPPPAVDVPPTPSGRRGIVRLVGRAFTDDDGVWNPLGASLFWALWGERHDPDRLERNLAHLASKSVDYVRILGMVGTETWADRVIAPAWPDYWDVVAQLFARLERLGLRAQVTIFADAQVMMPDPAAREDFVREWRRRYGQSPQVMFGEIANEHWQNGLDADEVRRLGAVLHGAAAWPVALSHTHDEAAAIQALYRGWPSVATIHYDRDTSKADGMWRPVRQPWGWPGEYWPEGGPPPVVVNNEPIGPDASVAADADPLRIALAYAVTFIAGNGAYCYHCGAGIRGGGAADMARGRRANVDEYDPAILDGLSVLRRRLPAGLANWRRANAQWAEFPWDGTQHADDRGDLVQAYATSDGHRLVVAVMGARRAHTVTARVALDLERWHPVTGAVLDTVRVAAGDTFTLPADLPGYLLIGTQR
jgi:hypothetical protein